MKTRQYADLSTKLQTSAMLSALAEVIDGVSAGAPLFEVEEAVGQSQDEAEVKRALEFISRECPRIFSAAATIAVAREYVLGEDLPKGGIHLFAQEEGDEQEARPS